VQALLDYASYAPHGYCLFWQPWLVALHVGADLLIATSYFAIPFALVLFLRRRPDLKYRGLVALFAAFILLCGITHLISMITLWIPIYPLQGLIKLATGIVSAVTAVVLFLLVPRLVAIPSPDQLEAANSRLRKEVDAHETTLERLREVQRTLELKVEERTAALTEANLKLGVLTREAVHRAGNLLTIVSSIAKYTGRDAADVDSFLERFTGRIRALANATATVAETQYAGQASASMHSLALRQLEPVIMTFGDRVRIGGPDVDVHAQAAQQLSLVLHELATNAQKHGALARAEGTVVLSWSTICCDGKQVFSLSWREASSEQLEASGGHKGTGFGNILLFRVVPTTLGAEAVIDGSEGYHYRLEAPLENIISPIAAETAKDEKLAAEFLDWVWKMAPGSPRPA